MAVTANNKPAMIERRKRFAFRILGMQALYGDGTNKEVNDSLFVEYYTTDQKGKSRKNIRSQPAPSIDLPAGSVHRLHIKEQAYNQKKDCKDLTQRREGVEKAAKKTTSTKEHSHPLRLSWLFLASLRWSFDFSLYCFGVKTVFPLFGL